jgi:hypothetical protein
MRSTIGSKYYFQAGRDNPVYHVWDEARPGREYESPIKGYSWWSPFLLAKALTCGIVCRPISQCLLMGSMQPCRDSNRSITSKSIHRVASHFPPKPVSADKSRPGDTVVIEDEAGLHIKTRDQLLAEVQALIAQHVPRGMLLSDEINEVRRSEIALFFSGGVMLRLCSIQVDLTLIVGIGKITANRCNQ